MSFTLTPYTQSLLKGLGHAEWIAAHLAEMSCSLFAVDHRLEALHGEGEGGEGGEEGEGGEGGEGRSSSSCTFAWILEL